MEEILKKILTKVEKIDGIESRLDKMDGRFDKVEYRLDKIESQTGKIDGIEGRLGNIENDVSVLKLNREEDSRILGALEHKAEVHKAELDKLNINVAKLSGEVKGVRRDINIVQIDVAKNSLDIALLKQEKINEA